MLQEKLVGQKRRLLLAVGLFVFLLCSWVVAQESAWYCRPYGFIIYRGDLAPDRLRVVAYIEGEEVASCQTKEGQYDLAIPKDNPETTKKDGWVEEDIITIKVGEFSAVPSFKAFDGSKKIDLRIPSMDVKPTTWGKIKALFK